MRIILIFSLLFFVSELTFSQVITVSDELNLKREYSYDILGRIGGSLLLIRDGINEFDIQAYDESMYMTWERTEELDSRKSKIINVVPAKDRFHVIYTDDWKDTTAIMVRVYDPKVQVEATDTLLMMQKSLIRPKYRFSKSEDQNIFLMTEIDNDRIVSAFAYDLKARRMLWYSALQFTDINFREEYRKTIVTNTGKMYLIFERNNFRYQKEKHIMSIFRFDYENEAFVTQDVPMPEFTTYDGFFTYDDLNESLVIVGLFSDRNSGITDGLYHLTMAGSNLSNYRLSTIDYDEELIADFHGKYSPKKEALTNLDVQDLILRQDGGVIVLAEESKEYERLSYGARRDYYGSSRFSVDYYYEDLVLISIHPDGTSHWQKLLPKRQYSNDDMGAYSSYYLFKNPSYLRILYNDEIRNENTVSEYILNGAGDISRSSLMSTDNQKLKLQIKNAMQIDSDELIVPSVRGNRLKLLKLQY